MLIAKFPQNKYHFELYDNTNQLTWQQIQKKTGCVAICNLWCFHLLNYSHQAAVMLDGKWACAPAYSWPGICIDRDGHVTTGGTADAVWDYAASVQADYTDGKRTNTTYWPKDGVTYTGLTAQGDVVILLSPEDSPMDSEEAVQAMLDAGCTDILRWDGSWSSQGSLGPGMDVQPSQRRVCRGWLLVFERETTKEDKPVDEITQAIMTNSACYKAGRTITPKGIMVHSTGTPGAMADQLRASWDSPQATAAVHAIIDDSQTLQTLPWTCRGWHAGTGTSGATANDTHIAFEISEPDQCRLLLVEWVPLYRGADGMPAWAVNRWQQELQRMGLYTGEIDGSFGPATETATKAAQAALGLTQDGSCGPATLAAAAAQPGSLMAYNPQEVEDYFAAVWDRSVALCVYLCKEYKLDPTKNIICHAEGYRNGVASNHADVEHWWPRHGKTMDDFRAAVKAAMGGGGGQTEPETPQQPEEPAEWYTDAQNWVTSLGIADGTRPLDNVTRAEVWVMLKRLYEAMKTGK